MFQFSSYNNMLFNYYVRYCVMNTITYRSGAFSAFSAKFRRQNGRARTPSKAKSVLTSAIASQSLSLFSVAGIYIDIS